MSVCIVGAAGSASVSLAAGEQAGDHESIEAELRPGGGRHKALPSIFPSYGSVREPRVAPSHETSAPVFPHSAIEREKRRRRSPEHDDHLQRRGQTSRHPLQPRRALSTAATISLMVTI